MAMESRGWSVGYDGTNIENKWRDIERLSLGEMSQTGDIRHEILFRDSLVERHLLGY